MKLLYKYKVRTILVFLCIHKRSHAALLHIVNVCTCDRLLLCMKPHSCKGQSLHLSWLWLKGISLAAWLLSFISKDKE